MARHYAWLFALALVGAAPAAQAQNYFGIGFGTTSADIQGDAEELFALGGAPCDDPALTCSFDEDDSGFKLFGGHKFAPNFALEGFCVDLGEATASVTDGANTATLTADATAFGVAAVGVLPIADTFDVLGKLGFARWSADLNLRNNLGASVSEDDDGTDPFFGIGAQWNANALSVRGEFERFDLDGTDVDLISLSVIFGF